MNENTISYKLDRINNAVDRIRVKTQTTGQPIENVATAVENTESISDYFDTNTTDLSTIQVGTKFMGGWIHAIKKLPKIKNKLSTYDSYFRGYPFAELDTSGLDTSIATNLSYMFSEGTFLKALDLSSFDTTNVTAIARMFQYCSNLTSLKVNNFNTTKLTSMYDAFLGCSSLTSLDLSSWNTSNVTHMAQCFSGCSSLTYLDIRNFDFTNVTSYSSMFGVPSNCLIIVKDDTAKSWITSKFTNLTNVKTVTEYEAMQ